MYEMQYLLPRPDNIFNLHYRLLLMMRAKDRKIKELSRLLKANTDEAHIIS